MSVLSRLLGGNRPHTPRSAQHEAGWPSGEQARAADAGAEAAQRVSDNEPRNFDRVSDEAAAPPDQTARPLEAPAKRPKLTIQRKPVARRRKKRK